MKPSCVKCQVTLRSERIGAIAIFTAYDPPHPYEAYNCDIMKCPKCGVEIISGWANQPFARSGDKAIYEAAQQDNAVFIHEESR